MSQDRQRRRQRRRVVSFGPIPGLAPDARLPTPGRSPRLAKSPEDELEDLVVIMEDLAAVVQSGHSLAIATGALSPADRAAFVPLDPEDEALERMSYLEKEQYLAWKGGLRPREFDPRTCKEPIQRWRGTLRQLDGRVRCLRAMYHNDDGDDDGDDEENDDRNINVTREHAVWFHLHADFMLPTLAAFRKLLSVKKHRELGRRRGLTPADIVERRTARRVRKECEFRKRVIAKEVDRLMQEIRECERDLEMRLRLLETKLAEEGRLEEEELRELREGAAKFGLEL